MRDKQELTLNPETETEFDSIWKNLYTITPGLGQGDAIRAVKQFIAKVEQRTITTTLERIDCIIGKNEEYNKEAFKYDSSHQDWSLGFRDGRNKLRAEQRQALFILKQELLKL